MASSFIKCSLGNLDILNLPLTAFLCSRTVPAATVLRCYDWAIAQREAGNCVISGFHSPLEKDVFKYLLKGSQPMVLALARGMKSKWEPQVQSALDEGRLLIVSPFTKEVRRASIFTAAVRNEMMIDLATQIVVGYANPSGTLHNRIQIEQEKKKIILVG